MHLRNINYLFTNYCPGIIILSLNSWQPPHHNHKIVPACALAHAVCQEELQETDKPIHETMSIKPTQCHTFTSEKVKV